MRHRRVPLIAAGAAILMIHAGSAAQTIHLPPAYRTAVTEGTPLLQFNFRPNKTPAKRVAIHDGQLIIFTGGGTNATQDVYVLGDQTLLQLAQAIQVRHGDDLEIIPQYPFYRADILKPLPAARTITNGLTLEANGGAPEVLVGFGVVFGLAEDPADDDDGLLDQAGFQLDLVGVHRILGPKIPDAAGASGGSPRQAGTSTGFTFSPRPQIYTQMRLGLRANQQLSVADDSQTDVQFEGAVRQADQIALTGQVELVWPLSSSLELSLVPEYTLAWARPEAFEMPRLPIVADEDPEPLAGYFDDDLEAEVLRSLRRPVPLRGYGANVVARFNRDGGIAFYTGVGLLQQQTLRRGIRIRRISTTRAIDPNFLEPLVSTPSRTLWRAQFGARLGGVIDVRVDAAGLTGGRTAPSALNLIIARDFPLKN